MKTVIIEDELFAADRLETILKEINPDIRVLAKLQGVKEAVKWFTTHTVDLVFLDIQLSDGLGFHIFEQVEIAAPIIFTTAYDQYAIKAFKLNSIDYLLKPVRRTELEESLKKYNTLRPSGQIDMEALMQMVQGKKPDYKKRFMVQYGEKIKKFEAKEIAFFYAMEKSIYLKTFTGPSYPLDYTLDRLEQEIDPALFFRVNRKYIVNIEAISTMHAYSRGRVKLQLKPAPDEENDCIVSIERSADFKKWLDN